MDERLNGEAGEQQAQGATRERQQRPFGHELSDQPRAACAKSQTDGKFSTPRLGAGQQQVCEIRAGDEQYDTDRGLQHPNRAAGSTKDFVAGGLHLQEVGAIPAKWNEDMELDADALAPVPDKCAELRLRRLCGDLVLQSPDEIEEMVAAVLAIRRVQT